MRCSRTLSALTVIASMTATIGAASAVTATAGAATGAPTVLLVHGVKPFNTTTEPGKGTDCASYWASAIPRLTPTNTVKTIGFYTNDANCDAKLAVTDDDGSTTTTINTNIHAIGKALAWYIYDNYSKNGGAPIKLVGHSMGGLVIFDAVQETALHHAGYPPFLNVNRVVTMASPLAGMRPQVVPFCVGVECTQFSSGANSDTFTLGAGTWLHDRLGFNTHCDSAGATATNKPAVPEAPGASGTGQTLWASIGSQWDTAVSSCSATSIQSNPTYVLPLSLMINHNEVKEAPQGLDFMVTNINR